MQTERSITTAILRRLNGLEGVYLKKTHGGAYSGSGWPDVVGCAQGRFVAMEVKRPGGRLTPLQESQLAHWRAAGAIADTVTSVGEAMGLLARHGAVEVAS